MRIGWILLVLAVAAWGQSDAATGWDGVVDDESGSAIANAIVELQSGDVRVQTHTQKNGEYHFSSLPEGSYRLSITFNGRTLTYSQPLQLPVTGVAKLVLSQTAFVSVEMGAKPAASGGETLSATSVAAIPLNKRDFSQLVLLAAGTMTDSNGATNFTQQFAINGQRGVEAVFAMDGADISDPEMGGATFSNFNVDAVQEIRSSSGWMPAEIGRGAAGFTDIVTRSGTDESARIDF